MGTLLPTQIHHQRPHVYCSSRKNFRFCIYLSLPTIPPKRTPRLPHNIPRPPQDSQRVPPPCQDLPKTIQESPETRPRVPQDRRAQRAARDPRNRKSPRRLHLLHDAAASLLVAFPKWSSQFLGERPVMPPQAFSIRPLSSERRVEWLGD